MTDDEQAWHRQVAVSQFNRCWELIESTDRSPDDDTEMLLAAATSRWHWEQIGGPEEVASGDWQIGHVASLLGLGDLAQRFAERSLARASAEAWTGWRLASAHEGVARACATQGDVAGRAHHLSQAEAALVDEEDAESARLIRDQMATVPDAPAAALG